MKKTMYIPKGQGLAFDNVTCENLIVNGSLTVSGSIKAKHISGNGLIIADSISASSFSGYHMYAKIIVVDKIVANQVWADEIHAVHSMAVSSFIKASSVKTGKITASDTDIENLETDEFIKLSAGKRSLLGTLFASAVRSKWATLMYHMNDHDEKCDIPEDDDFGDDEIDFAEVSKNTGEENLSQDPELQRIIEMYKQSKDMGYNCEITLKNKESNCAAPVDPFGEESGGTAA